MRKSENENENETAPPAAGTGRTRQPAAGLDLGRLPTALPRVAGAFRLLARPS